MSRHVLPELSQRISAITTLATIMVVFIHVGYESPSTAVGFWFHNLFCGYGLFACAVPCFFVISGYFLARAAENPGWWWQEVRKRIKTLCVPFWIWKLLYYIFSVVAVSVAAKVGYHLTAFGAPPISFSLFGSIVGYDLFEGTCLPPLWYIRGLMLFVVISPLLLWIVRWRMVLVGLFVLSVLFNCFPPGRSWYICFLHGFPVEGLVYFFAGMIIYSYSPRARIPISLLTIICGLLLGGRVLLVRHDLFVWAELLRCLCIPPLLLLIWECSAYCERLGRWSKNAFGVYVIHMFVINTLAAFWAGFGLRGFVMGSVLGYIVNGVCALLISVMIVVLMRRSKFLVKYLLGGRG